MTKQAFLATLLAGVFFIYDYYIKVSQGKCNVDMRSSNLIKNEIAGLLTKQTPLRMRLNSPESSDWEKHSQDKCLSLIPTALCGYLLSGWRKVYFAVEIFSCSSSFKLAWKLEENSPSCTVNNKEKELSDNLATLTYGQVWSRLMCGFIQR